jgi:hypothetical protein
MTTPCPTCGTDLTPTDDTARCTDCGVTWAVEWDYGAELGATVRCVKRVEGTT